MWNLERNDTNELMYKIETRLTDLREGTLWLPREEIGRDLGTDMYLLLYLKMDRQQGPTV